VISFETSLDITPELIRLNRIAGRFSNFKPVLGGRVDVLARRLIRRQFETEGRAGGQGGWKKLTPTYLARRVLPGKPILRQSDGLFEALTQKGHADQQVVLEKDLYSLTIDESADTHARFVGHQLGVPRSNLPARQMIPDPLPKNFINEVRQAVKAYVVRGDT
jgi:hypothetical protein